MLLFDEDAGSDELASGELASDERTATIDTRLREVDATASADRLRRLEELPTSLPVGGIITPV
jgi:hypothetical protein